MFLFYEGVIHCPLLWYKSSPFNQVANFLLGKAESYPGRQWYSTSGSFSGGGLRPWRTATKP